MVEEQYTLKDLVTSVIQCSLECTSKNTSILYSLWNQIFIVLARSLTKYIAIFHLRNRIIVIHFHPALPTPSPEADGIPSFFKHSIQRICMIFRVELCMVTDLNIVI